LIEPDRKTGEEDRVAILSILEGPALEDPARQTGITRCMRRLELTEIHDHPLFPSTLRNLTTDALEALWEFGNSYRPILGLLHECLKHPTERSASEPAKVLDLCSGGGGPWITVAKQLRSEYKLSVEVRLTDKYPNAEAFERVEEQATAAGDHIKSSNLPVDAASIPSDLAGFRTMFSAFHHFGPAQARAVLSSAVANQRGIGIFEVARRGTRTLLAVLATPLLVLWLTPQMRPFRWSRWLWTYILPVIPFVIGYDGIISCLRTYSRSELRELVSGLDSYNWQIGEARSGFLPVTYLIGQPLNSPD
jgi:hypothetical protein